MSLFWNTKKANFNSYLEEDIIFINEFCIIFLDPKLAKLGWFKLSCL